ncbi:MAG: glycosyltransferase family 9 protein [Acidobacteriaceae bacterium]
MVKRVLIYRLGSLGDTVMALPALHLVERAFPHARRVLLTNMPTHSNAPAASAVLEGSGLVHGYMEYPWKTRSVRDLLRLWWKIVRFRPQVAVYLMRKRGEHSLKRDTALFRLCGVREVIGLPTGDLAEPLYDPATDLWEQEGARLARCLRSRLGEVDVHDPANWDLRLTAEEQEKARAVLAPFEGRPLIACGPGTKMQSKDWGEENWRALLTRLTAELPDHGLVLIGAAQDSAVSMNASAGWRGPVANLCGLPPRETAAVLRHVELFLGPDSGQMHMAGAYGVPCAIVFASRLRRGHWFPSGEGHEVIYHKVECSLCELEECVANQRKCIMSISIEEMLAAALKARKRGAGMPVRAGEGRRA